MIDYTAPYRGSITREQFLFSEMRTTAGLKLQGLTDEEIKEKIIGENLYQYPTEKALPLIVRPCLIRLRLLESDVLLQTLAKGPAEKARQICLYAMMKQHRIVREFMVLVIGEKYRQQDLHYSKLDINLYYDRLREQDEAVAAWSDSTIARHKQILNKLLVDNGYLEKRKATELQPVAICPELENAIRANGEKEILPAFNCFY